MLNSDEKKEARKLLRQVMPLIDDKNEVWKGLWKRVADSSETHDCHNMPHLLTRLDIAVSFATQVNAEPSVIKAILLSGAFLCNVITKEEFELYGNNNVAELTNRIIDVEHFAQTHCMGHQENFSGLLLALCNDIRVVIVLIVRSLVLMQRINLHPDEKWVKEMAAEALTLYSELAHRLGLYSIKSTLEDLWLKYTDRATYKEIAARLSQTKRSRDAYITRFIEPVRQRLEEAGLKFTIKGRTKSIFSIWNKIRKKKVDMESIYDLFAIRVIIDAPENRETSDCWLGYSILANMYQPDANRMRDWLSFPKSNGYKSLHITVLGPERKWVEVQFRSRSMDLIAEKGLAAHWLYKGSRASEADKWMTQVRDMLEHGADSSVHTWQPQGLHEVYAFTPSGELLRLPPGSTLLDFAFAIHTAVGCRCIGGNVNGRYEKLSYKLRSGDTVKILTSQHQIPKEEWLGFVQTSKARNKIKQSLDETRRLRADLGREMLQRRMRNRKMEINDSIFDRMVARMGYKFSTDFLVDVADNKIDISKFLDKLRQEIEDTDISSPIYESAETFQLHRKNKNETAETLVIGAGSVRGMRYEMARCCSPLTDDSIFGFISAEGIIKIHRTDCPNAYHIRARFPYRTIGCRWAGTAKGTVSAALRIIGRDDVGIVTKITAIIDKMEHITLNNVQINSADGLFTGFLDIRATEAYLITRLIKKLEAVKGIRQVQQI